MAHWGGASTGASCRLFGVLLLLLLLSSLVGIAFILSHLHFATVAAHSGCHQMVQSTRFDSIPPIDERTTRMLPRCATLPNRYTHSTGVAFLAQRRI